MLTQGMYSYLIAVILIYSNLYYLYNLKYIFKKGN